MLLHWPFALSVRAQEQGRGRQHQLGRARSRLAPEAGAEGHPSLRRCRGSLVSRAKACGRTLYRSLPTLRYRHRHRCTCNGCNRKAEYTEGEEVAAGLQGGRKGSCSCKGPWAATRPSCSRIGSQGDWRPAETRNINGEKLIGKFSWKQAFL